MVTLKRWAILGIVTLAMTLVACGGSTRSPSNEPAAGAGNAPAATAAAASVQRGGTLRVALTNNPKNFDPMVQDDSVSDAVTQSVIESLYVFDDQLKPVPWLAERVDQPDEITYVFHLRQGVKFHDGTEMDAEAVKFSMDRIRENKASPRYRDSQEVTDTVVLDRYTFKLTLREPYAPFPSRLAGGLGAVVSPAAVRAQGNEQFNLHPVGTGPFRFEEWKSDNYVRVSRFEGYWRQGQDGRPLPYLDAVEWKIITEPTSRLTALQAGDVDIAAVRDQDLPAVKSDPNLVFKQQAGFSYSGLYLTINKPPFDNPALRQAVAYALDRDEIVRVVYEGNREIANGPIPPTLSWAIDPDYKPYTYDPAKAREKLAEGGRPNGFEFEYWIPAGDSQAQQLAELMQAQLDRVGIRMKIQAADFNGVVIPKAQKGESNAYMLGIRGGIDPDTWVSSAFQKGGGFNVFPYENPTVDELIRRGRRTSDLEQRARIYKEAVRLIMQDSPYIFTTHGVDRHIGNKRVQGWFVGPKATSGYSEYWLSK